VIDLHTSRLRIRGTRSRRPTRRARLWAYALRVCRGRSGAISERTANGDRARGLQRRRQRLGLFLP
jgi:hypothetical protein